MADGRAGQGVWPAPHLGAAPPKVRPLQRRLETVLRLQPLAKGLGDLQAGVEEVAVDVGAHVQVRAAWTLSSS